MNREKLLELADYIEASDEEFNMEDYSTCFCGHYDRMTGTHCDLGAIAGPEYNGTTLLFPHFHYVADYSKPQALRTLRHFAETGKVDWEIGK